MRILEFERTRKSETSGEREEECSHYSHSHSYRSERGGRHDEAQPDEMDMMYTPWMEWGNLSGSSREEGV
jgi:hypothetical protein